MEFFPELRNVATGYVASVSVKLYTASQVASFTLTDAMFGLYLAVVQQ